MPTPDHDPSSALTRLPPGRHLPGLWVQPIYRALGYDDALGDVWLRGEVAQRLAAAAARADDDGYGILIWDGWRPASLQRTLYDTYSAALRADTGLTGPALAQLTATFVTDPDRLTAPPAHSTGGAVDVTLCQLDTGTAIPMGGEFDELTQRSLPGFYDVEDDDQGRLFARRRAQLAAAMAAGGFVRLDTEWWHFEYGTALWAERRAGAPLFDRAGAPPG